jgi:hypothetical protein
LMLVAVLVLAGILAWVVWRNASPTTANWHRHPVQLAQIGPRPYVADVAAVAYVGLIQASEVVEGVT